MSAIRIHRGGCPQRRTETPKSLRELLVAGPSVAQTPLGSIVASSPGRDHGRRGDSRHRFMKDRSELRPTIVGRRFGFSRSDSCAGMTWPQAPTALPRISPLRSYAIGRSSRLVGWDSRLCGTDSASGVMAWPSRIPVVGGLPRSDFHFLGASGRLWWPLPLPCRLKPMLRTLLPAL